MAQSRHPSLQEVQGEALQSRGLHVKNGFIQSEPDGVARPRCLSAPPTVYRFETERQQSSGSRQDAECESLSSGSCRGKWGSADDFESRDSRWDDVSTHVSFSTHHDSRCRKTMSFSTLTYESEELFEAEPVMGHTIAPTAEEELRRLILHRCAFMRIDGSSYRDFTTPNGAGCTGSFVFYVSGLPFVKRNTWCAPMRQCVAKVLDNAGYAIQISGGMLCVGDNRRTFKVVVDFAASTFAPQGRPSAR